MRILAPVFEAGKVDLVFNGHVHNYQRSYPDDRSSPPRRTAPGRRWVQDGKLSKARHVDGKWTLDKTFNGKTDTTPEGVIYVVTGAGGQRLYNPEQQDDPASWQEFTYKHISKDHLADASSRSTARPSPPPAHAGGGGGRPLRHHEMMRCSPRAGRARRRPRSDSLRHPRIHRRIAGVAPRPEDAARRLHE